MSVASSAKLQLAFAELTGGVKFCGKKHAAEMEKFRTKSAVSGGGGGGRGNADAVASGSGRGDGLRGPGDNETHVGGTAKQSNKKKNATKGEASRVREMGRGVVVGEWEIHSDGDHGVAVFGKVKKQPAGRDDAKQSSGPKKGKPGSREQPPDADDFDAFEETLREAHQSAAGGSSRASNQFSKKEERANALRKRFKIRVRDAGGEGRCPLPLDDFSDLGDMYEGCGERLLARLAESGFTEPTPIQRQATTILLEQHELLAVAPTGSGKTLAFLLPVIVKLRGKDDTCKGPRAVILAPTKELAQQSHRILKLLCKGVNTIRSCLLTKATQMNEMDKVDVLVATPLRLKGLVEKARIDLGFVRFLILDEADKLFEMGFVEQIDAVVKACTSPKLTKALFSATLPEVVENLANSVMSNPMRLTVGERGAASETVAQSLVFCGRENGKLLALRQLFAKGVKPPVIVFVQSKDRAKQLAKELQGDGLRLGLIHAAMSDGKRQAQVDRFRGGDTWVLIATDLMARGMDFFGVSTVVNFDFPGSATAYVHRIGRSGRAGRPGSAVTLFTEEDAERGDLKQIANVMKNSGCDVPGWMLQSGSRDPKLRRRKRKDGREDNPRREAIDPRVAQAQTARETQRLLQVKDKDRAARKKRAKEFIVADREAKKQKQ